MAEEARAALAELRHVRNELRPRPSAEAIESAQKEVAQIDHQLISDLEQLMLTPRPPELEPAQFAALQSLRESRLRKDAALAQQGPLAVIELDDQHRHYERLIMAAERALFLAPQPNSGQLTHPPDMNAPDSVAEQEWQDKKPVVATQSAPVETGGAQHPGAFPTPVPSRKLKTEEHAAVVEPLNAFGSEGELAGAHGGKQQGSPSPPPLLEAPSAVTMEETLMRLLREAASSAHLVLDLSTQFGHHLDFLPDSLSTLSALTHLSLAENRLPELPDTIGDLSQLVQLELQYNKLRELPSTLGRLQSLTHLDVRSNTLEELPPELGRCRSLRYLNVASNKLAALPEALGACVQLETLVASLNHLRSLPTTLGGCAALTVLDVHFNEIRDVPAALGQCRQLRKLDLGGNFAALSELPSSLGDLSALQELVLSNNSIKHLPNSFGKLGHLRILALDCNPLKYPRKEVVAQGKDAVVAFLAEQLAAKEAEAAVLRSRSLFRKVFSKIGRRKSKDLIRDKSVDDLKRLA